MGTSSSYLSGSSYFSPSCCGTGNALDHQLNTESANEYTVNHDLSDGDDETHDQLQQQLHNKDNLHESQISEQRYNELVEQLNKYKLSEQKQKEQSTKLMDTKHELQHKIRQLTEIIDEHKQIESTRFRKDNKKKPDNELIHIQLLNEKNQMLQDLMRKLAEQQEQNTMLKQIVDAQITHNIATHSNLSPLSNQHDPQQLEEASPFLVLKSCDQIKNEDRVIATLETAQSGSLTTPDVKNIIMKQYKTVNYELDELDDDDDDKFSMESTSSLSTEEEIKIAQAKQAEIERQELDDEVAAMRREMKELQKESDPALLRINVDDDDESHLIHSGTEHKWDRASVINQKKEMEEAMTQLVKQAITPHAIHEVRLVNMSSAPMSVLSPEQRRSKMEQEEDEYQSSMDEAEKKEIERIRRKSEEIYNVNNYGKQPSLYRDGTRSIWNEADVDRLREDMRKQLESLTDILDEEHTTSVSVDGIDAKYKRASMQKENDEIRDGAFTE